MPIILATEETRDQEDSSLKPASANNSQDLILKNTHHKKGLMEWLKQLTALPSKHEALFVRQPSNPRAAKQRPIHQALENLTKPGLFGHCLLRK
jgi:hypothetical protein